MKKNSYDFYLVVATAAVLFAISIICIYAMFYFKMANLQQMAPAVKIAYMDRMNSAVAPFMIGLIMLLGICVPKRLFPAAWLNLMTAGLVLMVVVVWLVWDLQTALLAVLIVSLVLQFMVFCMATVGSQYLHFERKGYWLRLGSSLIHMGLILFILDLFLFSHQKLHLFLFWMTTGATVMGMTFCFYAEGVTGLIRRLTKR